MIRIMILLILWKNKRKEDARQEGDMSARDLHHISGLKRTISELSESAPDGMFDMETFDAVIVDLLEDGNLEIRQGGEVVIGEHSMKTHYIRNNLFLKTLADLLEGIKFAEEPKSKKI